MFQLAPQDPVVKREKPGGQAPKARVSSAVGARIEAPKGMGGGVPLPTGERSGEGAVPPPQKIFSDF